MISWGNILCKGVTYSRSDPFKVKVAPLGKK